MNITNSLFALFKKYVADGRSTTGVAQLNDAEIDIWKKHMHKIGDRVPRSKKK